MSHCVSHPIGIGVDPADQLVRVGPIVVGEIAYGRNAWRDYEQIAEAYRIDIPMNGELVYLHRNAEAVARRGTASVFGPDGAVRVHQWQEGTRVLVAKINRAAVESALAGLLGRPIGLPIAFDPAMPASAEPALSWLYLLRAVSRSDDLVRHPHVATPLADSVVHGFLLAANHPYRDELVRKTQITANAVILTAVDLIERHPGAAWTTTALAARCHVSARTLQSNFKNFLGTSPMGYVRMMRLRHARLDLRAADPSRTTVASVARNWGFSHLGRFSVLYRSAFGEPPSETLRARG